MSEFEGFFLLQNSSDLFRKLQHDCRRVEQNAGDHYAAFDFFVTAEHLLDWHLPGESNRDERKRRRRDIPVLGVVSHIANGAKHFRADAKHHTAVRRQSCSERGLSFPLTFPFSLGVEDLIVDLDGEAAAAYGTPMTVRELALQVVEYWTGEMSPER